VGGWISAGVNPRDYSYALMRNCLQAANACVLGPASPTSSNSINANSMPSCPLLPLASPLQILTQGYQETQKNRVVGTWYEMDASIGSFFFFCLFEISF
jgi:hypothetical protein